MKMRCWSLINMDLVQHFDGKQFRCNGLIFCIQNQRNLRRIWNWKRSWKNETEVLQKKDIDDANSMIQREEVDIEIINEEIQLIDNNQNQENANNKLNVMNEENTKKYQLNVWTYIVPKEIMIQDEDAQFHRIMKQSYIDVVLAGCLDIGGTQFAQEFVQTTAGWTPFMVWNDDRGQSNIFEDEE
eukprot:256198_1